MSDIKKAARSAAVDGDDADTAETAVTTAEGKRKARKKVN